MSRGRGAAGAARDVVVTALDVARGPGGRASAVVVDSVRLTGPDLWLALCTASGIAPADDLDAYRATRILADLARLCRGGK